MCRRRPPCPPFCCTRHSRRPPTLAVAGFLFTYYNSRATEERRARISRVNEQLKDFYGPLLAAVMTTKAGARWRGGALTQWERVGAVR